MTDNPISYPDALEIKPLDKPPNCTVTVPGSKSITNRALVLAALTARDHPCTLRGVLRCDDTEVMVEGLRSLGFDIHAKWDDDPPTVSVFERFENSYVPATSAEVFVANSGTTARFLTAVMSIGEGRFRIDGSARMRERPIEDLLIALRQLGADVRAENDNGCPPVVIQGRHWLRGGMVHVKGDVSSQFVSGLLMVASYSHAPVVIEVDEPCVSQPYIAMTVAMMRAWGFGVRQQDSTFFVKDYEALCEDEGEPLRTGYLIEPDASAASYFLAAAPVLRGRVTVLDIPELSLQGDIRFVDLLTDMGCRIERCSSGITVHGRPLHGIDVDMNAISDTVMTLAAVACFAEGPTTIRNVAHIRHKETDRISALATELLKVGAEVEEYPDGLKITPRPLHGAEIETYDDHRMAMSMALIGLRVPGIVIKNPGCVAKTYPRFWEDFERLRQ